jgi:hypothetical protein
MKRKIIISDTYFLLLLNIIILHIHLKNKFLILN